MTTKTKNRSTEATGNRPTHTVYHVVERAEDRKAWTPVGAAWPHKDGKGFSIRLDAIPVRFDGTLTVRERSSEDEGQ